MADTGKLQHDDRRDGATLTLLGPDGASRRVFAGPNLGQENCGVVAVYLDGSPVGHFFGTPSGGVLELRAASGAREDQTVLLDGGTDGAPRGTLTLTDVDRPDSHAFLGHAGAAGGILSGPMLVLADGERTVVLTTRGLHVLPAKDGFEPNFVAPVEGRPGQAIHYCVVEGPEVGVQIRGKATLVRGTARVTLPEHFAQIASEDALTVQLTPRARSSKGVAASTLTVRELVIEELGDGTGEYDVDWFVQGLRKGKDGYEVVRPWAPPTAPALRRSPGRS